MENATFIVDPHPPTLPPCSVLLISLLLLIAPSDDPIQATPTPDGFNLPYDYPQLLLDPLLTGPSLIDPIYPLLTYPPRFIVVYYYTRTDSVLWWLRYLFSSFIIVIPLPIARTVGLIIGFVRSDGLFPSFYSRWYVGGIILTPVDIIWPLDIPHLFFPTSVRFQTCWTRTRPVFCSWATYYYPLQDIPLPLQLLKTRWTDPDIVTPIVLPQLNPHPPNRIDRLPVLLVVQWHLFYLWWTLCWWLTLVIVTLLLLIVIVPTFDGRTWTLIGRQPVAVSCFFEFVDWFWLMTVLFVLWPDYPVGKLTLQFDGIIPNWCWWHWPQTKTLNNDTNWWAHWRLISHCCSCCGVVGCCWRHERWTILVVDPDPGRTCCYCQAVSRTEPLLRCDCAWLLPLADQLLLLMTGLLLVPTRWYYNPASSTHLIVVANTLLLVFPRWWRPPYYLVIIVYCIPSDFQALIHPVTGVIDPSTPHCCYWRRPNRWIVIDAGDGWPGIAAVIAPFVVLSRGGDRDLCQATQWLACLVPDPSPFPTPMSQAQTAYLGPASDLCAAVILTCQTWLHRPQAGPQCLPSPPCVQLATPLAVPAWFCCCGGIVPVWLCLTAYLVCPSPTPNIVPPRWWPVCDLQTGPLPTWTIERYYSQVCVIVCVTQFPVSDDILTCWSRRMMDLGQEPDSLGYWYYIIIVEHYLI